MASESAKLYTNVVALTESLDDLEKLLQPLFEQSLPETALRLETIQQAKLHCLVPYLVYDLVYVYLKSRGIDPKQHPVFHELERVRTYFEKIKDAENPPTRNLVVDKDAATRFIKSAIKNAIAPRDPPPRNNEDPPSAAASTSAKQLRPVPARTTSKMVERAQYEEGQLQVAPLTEVDLDLKVMDSASEDEEEMKDGDSGDMKDAATGKPTSAEKGVPSRRKGKMKATSSENTPAPSPREHQDGPKRRRPKIDPFTGYEDDVPNDLDSKKQHRDSSSRERKKDGKKKRKPLPLSSS